LLTENVVELMSQWCALSEDMADIRAKARSDFFGYDEPGTIKYMGGTEDLNGRERRFLGWFAFFFRLPDGKHPAELAVEAIISGPDLSSILKSFQGARYVLAVVTMVIPNKGAYLKLENEEFEVIGRNFSQGLHREDVVCVHLIPTARKRWVVGPGWFTWPAKFGPGIKAELNKFQFDPVQAERFLQMRSTGEEKPLADRPQDSTLESAVNRMTEAAKTAGKSQLILSIAKWKRLVLTNMKASDFLLFSKEIARRAGKSASIDELNQWLGLANNIWNNVPQPDRGNKSANDLIAEQKPDNQNHEFPLVDIN
jgi:hypothetical protein